MNKLKIGDAVELTLKNVDYYEGYSSDTKIIGVISRYSTKYRWGIKVLKGVFPCGLIINPVFKRGDKIRKLSEKEVDDLMVEML